MLYIGNFSFSDVHEQYDNICLMPVIVDAPDADAALRRFTRMLKRLHSDTSLLTGATDVFLDSLVEVETVPERPMVVQWQKITAGDDGLYSALSALPQDVDEAEAYAWGPEDELVDLGAMRSEVEEQLAEAGMEEPTAEELADALAEAFVSLSTGEGADLDDAADEEPFISFE